MESAGKWDVIPTIVIKSVSDYADSHKTKDMQLYAAAIAAACTKAVLEEWRPVEHVESGINSTTSRGINLANIGPPHTVFNGPVIYYVTTEASSSFQEIFDRSQRAIHRSNEEIRKSEEQREIQSQRVRNLNLNVANSLNDFSAVLSLFTIGPIIAALKLLMEVLFDARTDLNQIIRETDQSPQILDRLQEENKDAREAVVREAERIGAMEAGMEQGASEGYHYPGDEALVAEHSSTAQIIEEDRDSSLEGESVTQNDTDPHFDRNVSEANNTSTKLLLYQEDQVFSSSERDPGLSQDEMRNRIDILVTQEEELDEYIKKGRTRAHSC